MSLPSIIAGVGRTNIACQCMSLRPGINVRPPPSMMCVSALRSTAIGCAEIAAILLLRTRTLEGAESAALLPSKMRTFWKSVVPPSAEGAGCARLAWQSPIESTAASVNDGHGTRFDIQALGRRHEALKRISQFIAHAPFFPRRSLRLVETIET